MKNHEFEYDPKKQNITPGRAVKILAKSGVHVSEDEAAKILKFMYFMAELSVMQAIDSQSKSGK